MIYKVFIFRTKNPKTQKLKVFLFGSFNRWSLIHSQKPQTHWSSRPATAPAVRPDVFSVLNVKRRIERYREPVTPSCKACFDLRPIGAGA